MKKVTESHQLSEIKKVISSIEKIYNDKSITGIYIDAKYLKEIINVLLETKQCIENEILCC